MRLVIERDELHPGSLRVPGRDIHHVLLTPNEPRDLLELFRRKRLVHAVASLAVKGAELLLVLFVEMLYNMIVESPTGTHDLDWDRKRRIKQEAKKHGHRRRHQVAL